MLSGKRLLLISNRLPVSITVEDHGIRYSESIGGIATGLGAVTRQYHPLRIGVVNLPEEAVRQSREDIEEVLREKHNCVPVFLSEEAIAGYYDGFSNGVLWPLFHDMLDSNDFPAHWWHQYQGVNKKLFDKIVETARPGDIVWINDYHLLLLPNLIRRRMPYHKIGLFLHTPFPDPRIFDRMPFRGELLEGMLGADQIGLYTDKYKARLVDCIQRHRISRDIGHDPARAEALESRVGVFQIGVDPDEIRRLLEREHIRKLIELLRSRFEGRKVILSADRLDYTKGIPQKIRAYEILLERNPGFREARIQLILITAPCRMALESYRRLGREVTLLASSVNDRYGSRSWEPIYFIDRAVPYDELLGYYSVADVAVVTPLQDGMNLMSKEYMFIKGGDGGALILSRNAGSAVELSDAYLVDPNDVQEIAGALADCLIADRRDLISRNRAMLEQLNRQTASKWSRDFLSALMS